MALNVHGVMEAACTPRQLDAASRLKPLHLALLPSHILGFLNQSPLLMAANQSQISEAGGIGLQSIRQFGKTVTRAFRLPIR